MQGGGKRRAEAKGSGAESAEPNAQLLLDPLRRFVVFLESFAPLVNSLNLGIASPFLLGPPPLQLAHIKTQLALQQLNSVASNQSVAPYALLNEAFLKVAMFSPRGNMPPRPRRPNAPGPMPRGPFQGPGPGPGPGGLQRQHPVSPTHRMPQRFMGPDMRPGFPRPNVPGNQHRMDPRQTGEKMNMGPQQQKDEGRAPQWDNPFPSGNSNQGQPAAVRMAKPSPPVQRRYTNESASSILASFGLSNEDLEELSRYPDDQLTPENMPLILRDIRMRKTARHLPGLPSSQSRDNKESFHGDDSRSPMVKGKVIDYGHESKYGYTDRPLEVKVYNSDIEPVESAKEFPAPHPVTTKQMNAVEELIRQMGFQRSTPSAPSFFPMDTKAPGLAPPPVQPMMPPVVPSAPPPAMVPQALPPPPPIAPPMMANMSQLPPPFAPEVMGGVKDRTAQESKAGASRTPREPTSSQKKFQKETEGPISSPFGVVKASWLPNFSEMNAQKMKRLPTPSMMNDYYAMSPRIFPHICSLCNVEFRHLQDWIEHQNSSAHLESCRQLRQQYPDWNPESLSSPERHERNKKENHSPKRHASGPRRFSSGHARRRGRSRSGSPRYYRTSRPRSRERSRSRKRSWSRQRSRSRPRSQSGLQSRSRPQSRSPRRPPRSWSPQLTGYYTPTFHVPFVRGKDPGRPPSSAERALRAVEKRSGPHYAERSRKHESYRATSREISGRKGVPAEGEKPVGSRKKPPSGTSKASKAEAASPDAKEKSPDAAEEPSKAGPAGAEEASKAGTAAAEDASKAGPAAAGKEKTAPSGAPAVAAPKKTPSVPQSWLLSSKAWGCGTVLRISDLPDDGFTEQDIKKIVQPFGKVSDILVLHSRNEAYLEMNYKEAVIAAIKYAETTPVLVNKKRVKIAVAEKSKAPPSQNKGSQKSVKKPPLSTKKDQTKPVAKPDKPVAAEAAASKTSNKKPVKMLKAGKANPAGTQKKAADAKKAAEPKKAAVKQKKPPDSKKPEDAKRSMKSMVVDPRRPVKHEKKAEKPKTAPEKKEDSKEASEPVKEEAEEGCVVAISSLPEAGLGLEEILNLTKPFGKLKDVFILSSHKKAYIEISRTSADLMVKFYTCFPMWVEKNQLCISLVPEFKDLKDEEAIFISLIKDVNAKINVEGLHAQFVHLGNLPDKGYSELEILCVGLRFGRVDHYMVIANKNKAILQLDSAESAASMCRFLKRYPYSLGELQLTFSRSPQIEPVPVEVVKKVAEKQEPSKESPDMKAIPEGSGVGPPSAVVPPSPETKEEPGSDPKALAEVKAELSGAEETACDGAAPESLKTETSEEGSAVGAAVTELLVDLPSSGEEKAEEEKSEEALTLPSSSTEKKEVPADSDRELQGNAGGNASEELSMPADKEPSEGLSGEVPRGSLGSEDSAMASGEVPQDASGPEAVPVASAESPAKELPGTEQVSEHKPVAPEAEGTEPSIDLSETPASEEAAVVDKQPESSLAATEQQHMEMESKPIVAQTKEDTAEKLASPPAKAEKAAVKEEAEEDPASNNGAVKEDKPEKNVSEESPEQVVPKKEPSKGPARTKAKESWKAPPPLAEPAAHLEASSASKTILKALLSVPNIAKKRVTSRWKAEHKPAVKPGTRSQGRREEPGGPGPKREQKRPASREASRERLASGPSELPDSAKAKPGAVFELGNEKTRSQSEKDPQGDAKGPTKQRRERENRSSSLKRDSSSSGGSSNKASAGRSTRSSRSTPKPKQEEELSSFNLDEFVTMDEVTDEMDSPSQLRRNPARGKRREPDRKNPFSYEPSSKRKKSKPSGARAAESEVSFVTLDEIGEDEAGAAQAEPSEALPDPQTLVTVDEVNEEEEELMDDMIGDPQALVTLDEISEQEETAPQESPKKAPEPSEANLKAEPLVTLDEICEQEEMATQEAAEPGEANVKAEPLVTLDEISEQEEMAIQEATEETAEPSKTDQKAEPLVTLDKISEKEEMVIQGTAKEATEPSEADLKAEPLVTLDEISEQEEPAVQESTKEASASGASEADLKTEPSVTVDEISEREEPAVGAAAPGASDADPKAEPLVTVDEIGEVEEDDDNSKKVSKPREETKRAAEEPAQDPAEFLSSQMPEDPSTLVTVDEIHEDSDDQPLVTLDEVTEDEEDFLEDFNCLKEEFNFVTVDEVGSEEEEEEEEGASADGNVEEPVAQAVPQEGEEVATPADEPEKEVVSSSPLEEIAIPESYLTEEAAGGEAEEELKEAPEAQAEELKKERPDADDAAKEGQEATLEDEGKHEGDEAAKTCEAAEADRKPEPLLAEGAAQPSEISMETESESHVEGSAVPEAAEMEAGGSSVSAPDEEKEEETGSDAQALSTDASTEENRPAEAEEPEAKAALPVAQDPDQLPDTALGSGGEAAPPQPLDEKPEKDLAGSEGEEPEAKRRKVVDSSENPKAASQKKGLDFLVPKAGFFCQICSCFCVDETSMKSHCETELHQQNMEKFMKSDSSEEKEKTEGGKEAEKPSSA